MKIISRKQAQDRNLPRYFTGKPCKHGHVAERLVGGCNCVECAVAYREENKDQMKKYHQENKDQIAARMKKYREENKEKVAARMKKYHQENKDKLAARDKKYREENKEKVAARRKKYYEENKDQIAAYKKKYHQENKEKEAAKAKKYREENKEQITARRKKYYEENKEKVAAIQKGYREENKDKLAARKKKYHQENPLQAFTRNTLTRIEKAIGKDRINRAELEIGYTQQAFIEHIESQFKDGMSWDNRSEWHIDHKRPLSLFLKEGVTDPKIINALSNLQPLWWYENLSKGASY